MDKRDGDPDIRGAARDEGRTPRRREVILTAGRLFREHGYERTTVRELAKAVGCNRAACSIISAARRRSWSR